MGLCGSSNLNATTIQSTRIKAPLKELEEYADKTQQHDFAIPSILKYKNKNENKKALFRNNDREGSDETIDLDYCQRQSGSSVILKQASDGKFTFESPEIHCMIESSMSSKLDE